MLDMSWGEVMVIGAVALIVIGPKDLPRTLRTVGQMTGKIRRMAAEFQGQFNEAMREAELDDVKRQIQDVNDSVTAVNPGFDPIQTIRDELKGAVEGTSAAMTSTPGTTVSDAPVASPEGTALSAPAAPSTELPAPSLPAVADPAETVAIAVQQSSAAPTPQPAPAEQRVATGKRSEKAE
jgi:sec-independent protein translocase protein TatB